MANIVCGYCKSTRFDVTKLTIKNQTNEYVTCSQCKALITNFIKSALKEDVVYSKL